MDRYPNLGRLFGAYLNQDVFDFYPDEFAGAAAFASEDPVSAQAAAEDIDQLLSESAGEAQLHQALDQLGAEIGPVDLTYREWLTRMADRVRASTDQR